MMWKIEITFKDEARAQQFKNDMLNLEHYGITMGPIVEINEFGAPVDSANPSRFPIDPKFKEYHNDAKHTIEADYPDDEEG